MVLVSRIYSKGENDNKKSLIVIRNPLRSISSRKLKNIFTYSYDQQLQSEGIKDKDKMESPPCGRAFLAYTSENKG